jgi:catechol 2,3-dioxygenase-like lactoylglutathione lyase family enzyme
MNAPRLDGFHHVKIPVTDIQRSLDWYRSRLGFTEGIRFVEDGVLSLKPWISCVMIFGWCS